MRLTPPSTTAGALPRCGWSGRGTTEHGKHGPPRRHGKGGAMLLRQARVGGPLLPVAGPTLPTAGQILPAVVPLVAATVPTPLPPCAPVCRVFDSAAGAMTTRAGADSDP